MKDYIYVVTAKRWGENETHNYIVGSSIDYTTATEIAEEETDYRGGKYACIVEHVPLGNRQPHMHVKEVYRTKSQVG